MIVDGLYGPGISKGCRHLNAPLAIGNHLRCESPRTQPCQFCKEPSVICMHLKRFNHHTGNQVSRIRAGDDPSQPFVAVFDSQLQTIALPEQSDIFTNKSCVRHECAVITSKISPGKSRTAAISPVRSLRDVPRLK